MTREVREAKRRSIPLPVGGGKAIPAFNGSQNSRKNKKRPITLPGIDRGLTKS
jgi:hypothetical protein